MDRTADIAIVGGGIVGLAHAYIALRKGYRVVMFEREQFATGASVRNFGLLWPIGQQPGAPLDRALRSRSHWGDICEDAGIWISDNGSLHLAYHDDEWQVLQEFMSLYPGAPYDCRLITPQEVALLSPLVKTHGLKGGLLSMTEATVYSREALRRLPLWLEDQFGLMLRFGQVVTEIALPQVHTSRESWTVQKVYVCSGTDFETLYPHVFDQHPVTKCRLQMMKAVMRRPLDIGPSLCAGLTLRHYAAFAKCNTLKSVDERYDLEMPEYKEHGIHVLLAQNAYGELIIGDSHHYGSTIEPFDAEGVNEAILRYLSTFADLGAFTVTERWHGVYAKATDNKIIVAEAEPGVTIVNGLGGAGMTLSFGLAEEVMASL